jgi:hypothetical protein
VGSAYGDGSEKKVVLFVLLSAALCYCGENTVVSSRPTHHFFTPASYINSPYSLVIGLHEFSFSLPNNLQLQASLFDNIGRLNMCAKYSIMENLSVAGGVASTIVHLGGGSHGIALEDNARLGAFVCFGFVFCSAFERAFTLHTQIWDKINAGLDFGMMTTPSYTWAIIFEAGSSYNFSDKEFLLNFESGIRINPPVFRLLFLDLGVVIEDFVVRSTSQVSFTMFFDTIVALCFSM